VRLKNSGISLIELLVIVILISTVATAFLNIRDDLCQSNSLEPRFSAFDSALYAAIDIIASDFQLACLAQPGEEKPLVIEHQEGTDIIRIKKDNCQREYLVDADGRLVRIDKNGRFTLARDIVSLRVLELGKATIVLTVTARAGGESFNEDYELRSYSRVTSLNFPLE
jgi:hypothetical protein